MTRKMQAAFVERFGKPLVFMEVDVPTPALARSWSRPRPAASATPTFTPPPAIGR